MKNYMSPVFSFAIHSTSFIILLTKKSHSYAPIILNKIKNYPLPFYYLISHIFFIDKWNHKNQMNIFNWHFKGSYMKRRG